MWLVLCDSNDTAALWAFEGLRARGLLPLEIVTAEVLLRALTWEHRLGVDGVSFRIALANKRTIKHDELHGVLNRLTYIDPQLLALSHTPDRLYAAQEMTALFMSWLAALACPVLNRPVAQGLSGSWRHPSEWTYLASQAGLSTSVYKQSVSSTSITGRAAPHLTPSAAHTIFVIKDIGVHCHTIALPVSVADACRRLGALARTDLLGIELAADGSWTFIGASPQPDIRLGGAGLLDALTAALRNEEQEERQPER